MPKDLFSQQAADYARYRPLYPAVLFQHILAQVSSRHRAWDCGTGNGQAAFALASYFTKVMATDISEKQLALARQHPQVEYLACRAEQTPFSNNSFDLITVAQAYHWFNFEAFKKEAIRVGKPGAVVAVWGYGLLSTPDAAINAIIQNFYHNIVGPYWDAERKYLDEGYTTIPFEFAPLPGAFLSIDAVWNRLDLLGHFQSWSSVQHYKAAHQVNPVTIVAQELVEVWKAGETKPVSFPLFLLQGRIEK